MIEMLSGKSGCGISERWKRYSLPSTHSNTVRPGGASGKSTCSVHSPTNASRRSSARLRADWSVSMVAPREVSIVIGVPTRSCARPPVRLVLRALLQLQHGGIGVGSQPDLDLIKLLAHGHSRQDE